MPSTLEQAFVFFQEQDYSYEVLVVENGSQDRTFQIAKEFSEKHPHFYVFREADRGKGLAVRRGMLEARGQYRFMCDADLSMPIMEVNRFLPPTLEDFDIAIASREAPGAVRYNEPEYRHIGGRALNFMIRTLALPGLQDTQCGFKCFRGVVAEELFGFQTLTGWSFDIELLFIARRRGYRIVEIPIGWHYSSDSKVSPIRDAVQMGIDLLTIQRNARGGIYDRKFE